MRGKTLLGLVLILIGAVALILGEIPYTASEHEIDLGPVEMKAKEEKTLPIPRVVSGLILLGGVGLVGHSALKKRP